MGKIKVKNTVTVSQEKVLQETTERLQREQRELQDTQHRLRLKEDEVNSFFLSAIRGCALVALSLLGLHFLSK